MIYTLKIKDPKQTPVPWLANIETFKAPRTFEFSPGLNILWGRNGSGKTSLIKALARLSHCAQSNQPVVTQDSLRELVGERLDDVNIKNGVSIVHDGQGVRHFDPSHAVGLVGGQAGFDDEFMLEGLVNTMFKGSAGQTTRHRFDRLMNEIVAGEIPNVEWKISRTTSNNVWTPRIKLAEHFLEGNADEGQPTVLLDEPERSYDLNTQIGVWRFMRAYADKVQFIVASHSLFALKIPDANYIELSPRYLATSETALDVLQKWSEEKPKKLSAEMTKEAQKSLKARKGTSAR